MLGDRLTDESFSRSSTISSVLNHTLIYAVVFAIIFCVAFVVLRRQVKNYRRKRLSSYDIDYQKLNVNYSRKFNLNRRQPLGQDNDDEDEEDDDEELTLFEKT